VRDIDGRVRESYLISLSVKTYLVISRSSGALCRCICSSEDAEDDSW